MGQDADELKRDIERTRDDLGGTLDAIGDRVSPSRIMERRKNRMRNAVESMRLRVMGAVHDGTHAVHDSTGQAAQRVGDSMDSAVDSLRHAPEMAKQRTEGAPMVAGALAFGVGFLAAAAFPPSKREREMAPQMMDKVEPIKQEVASAGAEIAQHLQEPAKQHASEIGERVKEGAHEVSSAAGHEVRTP
jgi:hypothetical protein